jgi:ceramide synthetase
MMTTKDLVLGVLLVAALLWGGRVALDVHQEVRVRQQRRPEAYPPYSDLLEALGIAGIILVAQLLFRPIYGPVARAMIVKQTRWSWAVHGAKVTRASDSAFKCMYYALMTMWCYTLLREEPWLPTALGGRGATRSCWTDGYPFQAASSGLRRCYLASIGVTVCDIAMLLMESRKPDFWEMLLHHVVTCSLVGYSYMLNYVRIGSLVLLLHHATDVFIHASKAFVDTPNKRIVASSYFGLVLTYAYLRVYVYPVSIMRSAWMESMEEASSEHIYGWGYFNFALCVLLLLHIYWFGLIVKIGLLFRSSGQTRDLQANLSSMDLKKKE